MSDILRPILCGLKEAGHRAQVSPSEIQGDFVQILAEYFVTPAMVDFVRRLKSAGLPLGLLLTEDGRELSQLPENAVRWSTLLQVLPQFDFFWCFSDPAGYSPHVPRERIHRLEIGGYTPLRTSLFSGGKTKPDQDFIIYGRRTQRREDWRTALSRIGITTNYTYAGQGTALPLPDYMLESKLADGSVLLDIARSDDVTLASTSRLAFALQNNLPVISDAIFDLSQTSYADYVPQMSLEELLDAAPAVLSPAFRISAAAKGSAWRNTYPMARALEPAVSLAARTTGRI